MRLLILRFMIHYDTEVANMKLAFFKFSFVSIQNKDLNLWSYIFGASFQNE